MSVARMITALHDEQLHASAERAFRAGRTIYGRLRTEPDVRAAARRLASDRRLQSELRVVMAETKAVARHAANPRARRRRLMGLLVLTGAGALAYSSFQRKRRD